MERGRFDHGWGIHIKNQSSKGADRRIDGDGKGGSSFGYSLDVIGDINGDGVVDLFIGSPDSLDSNGDIVTGLSNLAGGIQGYSVETIDGFKVTDEGFSLFGNTIRNLGDVNGDGINDIGVTAPGGDRAFVIFGR